MDYQARINSATRFRDQTKDNYDEALSLRKNAKSTYNNLVDNKFNFSNQFDANKQKFFEKRNINGLHDNLKKSQKNLDGIRQNIDNLHNSVLGQFRRSSLQLDQSQYEKALESQFQKLNTTQGTYSKIYKAQQTNYNKQVEGAFSEAMDVTNKQYDTYWDKVRTRFKDWQTSIKNADKWSSNLSTANMQLENSKWELQKHKFRTRQLSVQQDINNLEAESTGLSEKINNLQSEINKINNNVAKELINNIRQSVRASYMNWDRNGRLNQ